MLLSSCYFNVLVMYSDTLINSRCYFNSATIWSKSLLSLSFHSLSFIFLTSILFLWEYDVLSCLKHTYCWSVLLISQMMSSIFPDQIPSRISCNDCGSFTTVYSSSDVSTENLKLLSSISPHASSSQLSDISFLSVMLICHHYIMFFKQQSCVK